MISQRDPARGRLVDRRGRTIDYLRLSVTDRCNHRCRYCMPEEGVEKIEHRDVLRLEEAAEVCRAAADLGVRKVRVTGGEPLVRRGVEWLVAELARTPGVETVALTTNGSLLAEAAADLHAAGLDGINVSLDTLDPERFREITRGGDLGRVLEGIDGAVRAGLPTKINAVLLGGVNADPESLWALASFAAERGAGIRFIEMMDFGLGGDPVYLDEALAALGRGRRVEPIDRDPRSPHVTRFSVDGLEIGFIAPISRSFCETCNKLRLTPDGRLLGCLVSGEGVDVREILRGRREEGDLERAVLAAVERKPHEARWPPDEEMWRVGG